ncbi:MAG: GspH/FimT family pseudopilin [Thermodesulfobacteriota bacterium]
MRKDAGVTLMEVLIVVAIIGVLTAIAIPNWLSWRANAKINGAATNLRGDLEMAKMRAIKENASVAIIFSTNGYIIFIDNGVGAGIADNWVQDGNEIELTNRQFTPGVSMSNTFASGRTRFSGSGRPGNIGTAALSDSRGVQRQVIINTLGRIRLQY